MQERGTLGLYSEALLWIAVLPKKFNIFFWVGLCSPGVSQVVHKVGVN